MPASPLRRSTWPCLCFTCSMSVPRMATSLSRPIRMGERIGWLDLIDIMNGCLEWILLTVGSLEGETFSQVDGGLRKAAGGPLVCASRVCQTGQYSLLIALHPAPNCPKGKLMSGHNIRSCDLQFQNWTDDRKALLCPAVLRLGERQQRRGCQCHTILSPLRDGSEDEDCPQSIPDPASNRQEITRSDFVIYTFRRSLVEGAAPR